MLVATITDRLYSRVGAVGLAALRAPTSRQLSALNCERKACNWRSIESRSIVACGTAAAWLATHVTWWWWCRGLVDLWAGRRLSSRDAEAKACVEQTATCHPCSFVWSVSSQCVYLLMLLTHCFHVCTQTRHELRGGSC